MRKPCTGRVVLRKRRISDSSSIRTIVASCDMAIRSLWRRLAPFGLLCCHARLLFRKWNGESKHRPTPGSILGPDSSAVRFDDSSTDSETKPNATFSSGLGAVKLVEDPDFLSNRNSLAAICDFDHHFTITG